MQPRDATPKPPLPQDAPGLRKATSTTGPSRSMRLSSPAPCGFPRTSLAIGCKRLPRVPCFVKRGPACSSGRHAPFLPSMSTLSAATFGWPCSRDKKGDTAPPPSNRSIPLVFSMSSSCVTRRVRRGAVAFDRWTFYSPECLPFLYPTWNLGANASPDPTFSVNPTRPSFDKFPLFRLARPTVCTLQPGEFLFVPAGE